MSTTSSPRRGFGNPATAATAPWSSATRYDFEDRALFTVVRGEDYCDLSDHYAVWGYFDYRDAPGAPPDCPLPAFPPG